MDEALVSLSVLSFCLYSGLRPRPHYTVFKRKRYYFVPFSKRFASTLIVSVSFSPVHTTTRIRIENALKPYILSYSPFILPLLLSSRQIKVVPLRRSSSWSCPEPSRILVSGLRPSRFYYHRSAQSCQAKKLYIIFYSS